MPILLLMVPNVRNITWHYWANCTQSLKSMNPIYKDVNRPLMNLIPTETLVFFLYLNKFANSSLNPEKVSLQNWKPIFPVISRILYNEWHGQTSL